MTGKLFENKILKKAGSCLIAAILLFTFAVLLFMPSAPETASANSGPMEYDQNAPLELIPVKNNDVSVTSETLTFDTVTNDKLPETCAKITASYVFDNAGEAQTITLGFPYVGYSYYHLDESERPDDFYDVDISFNGKKITPEKLFGRSYYEIKNLTFAQILEDTNLLNAPNFDVPCTLYTFTKNPSSETENVVVEFSVGDNDLQIFDNSYDRNFEFGQWRLSFFEYENVPMQMLIVGGGVPLNVSGGSFAASEMTFGEFLDEKNYDRAYANAKLNILKRIDGVSHNLYELELSDYTENLTLLKYDADFIRGENTMTVSYNACSSVSFAYKPNKYKFDYISKPAGEWADFSNLTVKIITDKFVLDSNVEFEKTSYGYTAFYENLPEENISFTLCASENPDYIGDRGFYSVILMTFAVILCLAVAAVLIGIIIYYCVKTSNIKSRY